MPRNSSTAGKRVFITYNTRIVAPYYHFLPYTYMYMSYLYRTTMPYLDHNCQSGCNTSHNSFVFSHQRQIGVPRIHKIIWNAKDLLILSQVSTSVMYLKKNIGHCIIYASYKQQYSKSQFSIQQVWTAVRSDGLCEFSLAALRLINMHSVSS